MTDAKLEREIVRCTDAILAAFLSHPSYRDREDLVQIGLNFVLSGKKGKEGNWAFAYYLPSGSAKHGLTRCLPEIIQAQLPTGNGEEDSPRRAHIEYSRLSSTRICCLT